MAHDALIIAILALAAIAFGWYMWHTRVKRREFAQRLAQARVRNRRSLSGSGLPRGLRGGWRR